MTDKTAKQELPPELKADHKTVKVWRKDRGHEQVPESKLKNYLASGWVLSSTRRK